MCMVWAHTMEDGKPTSGTSLQKSYSHFSRNYLLPIGKENMSSIYVGIREFWMACSHVVLVQVTTAPVSL